MAERWKEIFRWCWEHRRAHVVLAALFLLLTGMITAFFLTYDKEPQLVSAPVIVVNENYDDMGANPLTGSSNKEVNEAVEKYYTRLLEHEDYVEAYEDMDIYSKKGWYENTYVVFVKYNMKIKGIYTPVPGLGTLYVEKTENEKMKVVSEVEDEKIQHVIADVTVHEDVKGLFREVEESFEQAIQSDAMLAEAVNDLQTAVKGE